MYAITVKQPWAEAIARHGKSVENRTRRPPAHLIGQRVAIHVGQNADAFFGWQEGTSPHLATLDAWMRKTAAEAWDTPHWGDPPNAGRIIATARLVGTVRAYQDHDGDDCVCMELIAAAPDAVNGEPTDADRDLVSAACRSPWFTGPVGWVLADVRPLAVPVGMYGACGAPRGIGGGHVPCGVCGHMMLEHGPIRGQLYPFALSPEVEAAILRQEHNNA